MNFFRKTWKRLLAPLLAVISGFGCEREGSTDRAPEPSADAVPFDALHWVYGGVRAATAKPVEGARIEALSVAANGLRYRWTEGGCEALGASSREDASATLACLFVKDADGVWRGGKFDWISTSRTARDFENIKGNYNGWPKDAIEKGLAFAFVIVSKDGARRTNVIVE